MISAYFSPVGRTVTKVTGREIESKLVFDNCCQCPRFAADKRNPMHEYSIVGVGTLPAT